jgi:hypothetical protein|tara:strand:- start:274 stop:441 length:168 start_codon:yes stop_codon:yes gene_type:complete
MATSNREMKEERRMNIFKEFQEADAAHFEKLMKQVICLNVVCFIACAVVMYVEFV